MPRIVLVARSSSRGLLSSLRYVVLPLHLGPCAARTAACGSIGRLQCASCRPFAGAAAPQVEPRSRLGGRDRAREGAGKAGYASALFLGPEMHFPSGAHPPGSYRRGRVAPADVRPLRIPGGGTVEGQGSAAVAGVHALAVEGGL